MSDLLCTEKGQNWDRESSGSSTCTCVSKLHMATAGQDSGWVNMYRLAGVPPCDCMEGGLFQSELAGIMSSEIAWSSSIEALHVVLLYSSQWTYNWAYHKKCFRVYINGFRSLYKLTHTHTIHIRLVPWIRKNQVSICAIHAHLHVVTNKIMYMYQILTELEMIVLC